MGRTDKLMRRDRTDATTQAVISYVGAGLTAVRTIPDRPSDLISIGVAWSSLNDMAGGHYDLVAVQVPMTYTLGRENLEQGHSVAV